MNKPVLIAEAGISHMGSAYKAGRLCTEAKEAGADGIKFQLFTAFSRPFGKEFILQPEVWGDIVTGYNSPDFKVFFSVFDFESLALAKGLSTWVKLSFIEKQNRSLIERVNKANFERKFISVDLYEQYERKALTGWEKLYCPNTGWKASYPTPLEEIEFKRYSAINNLASKESGGYKKEDMLGFSCHGRDYRNCLISAALGAPVIEKHFKLEDDDYSPDKDCSITPSKFLEMADIIRDMESINTEIRQELGKVIFPER